MSVTVDGSSLTFTTSSGSEARARSEVTTTDPSSKVSFRFSVQRRGMLFRVGTSAGGQEIIPDMSFEPGEFLISFTPDVSTYYIEWSLPEIGTAKVINFAREASGDFELVSPWSNSILGADGSAILGADGEALTAVQIGDVSDIRTTQSLDVMWLMRQRNAPRVLERRGATSWGLRLFRPATGPFELINTTDVTLSPAALEGTTTITASKPIFRTFDVGGLLKLSHLGQYKSANLNANGETSGVIKVSGKDSSREFGYVVTYSDSAEGTVELQRSVDAQASWDTVISFTDSASGKNDDGLTNEITYYRFKMTAYTSDTVTVQLTHTQALTEGVGRIVTVDADNQVTVDVLEPFAKTEATLYWHWGSWSDRYGWPVAGELHDGRLSTIRVDRYWLSKSDQFWNMETGTLADDAIDKRLTGQINTARWLKSVNRLLVGTAGAEHWIGTGVLNERLEPSNATSKVGGDSGSASADAILIGDSVAYISRNKKRIYLISDTGDGKFTPIELTRLNRDIGGASGFKKIQYQKEPEPRLWALRNDGKIAVLCLNRTENVAAWSIYQSDRGDHLFEDVCVTPNSPEDNVYFITNRTINGATKRSIEQLAAQEWDTLSEAWRLQAAIEYNGASTNTVTGLDHLEAEEVYAWADGRISGPHTVSGGSITIGYNAERIIVGLNYIGKYKGPRLDWGAEAGTALTSNKQIKHLGLILKDTAGGCLAWGRDYDNVERLADKKQNDNFDSALSVWSGTLDKRVFDGETGLDVRLHILMDKPGPAEVLALTPLMDTNAT